MLARNPRALSAAIASARLFSSAAPSTSAADPETFAAASTASCNGRHSLGRRLLRLVSPKRSAVRVIREWAEEGNRVHKHQLIRVVKYLRLHQRHFHALQICEWMSIQPSFKLSQGDYAIHLDLIAKVHGLVSAENFLEGLPEGMRGQSTCNALLHTYVLNNMASKAEALMGKMSERGLLYCALPYNHMLKLYISNGHLNKVPWIMQELKKNACPDVLTYNLWLGACAKCDDVKGAEKIFLEMEERNINPDWLTYSTLATIYINGGSPKRAATALKEMEKRITPELRAGYCSLISLHAKMKNINEVNRIWGKMKSMFRKMSNVEYICMLASVMRLGESELADNIYSEWESESGSRDTRIVNTLLGFYIRYETMDKAEGLFERMVNRGINPCHYTWELLASGYLHKKRINKALDCLDKAQSCLKKWKPNDELIRSVLRILEEQGYVRGADKLLAILQKAGCVTMSTHNSVLHIYAKAGLMLPTTVECMEKENVQLDEETCQSINMTNKLSGEDPNMLSLESVNLSPS
ncbi:Pentatricopeptide repeat-containing protein [Acorus gramineus]|uniref:Pentatricopeptide repeat-containing protein n=1 Tax=Acorus gramineus TaxID=55184 RepID=A0AAV9A1Q2_ACOGR|nr:Pentatricopeptide repeat-containing protein [Acorus gramineus]